MKTIIALALLVTFSASLVACNTTEGLGKDTKNAGQSIENTADRNK